MLLKNYNKFNKNFFFDFIFKNNTFFVININDYEHFNFYNFCLNFLKIFHNKSFLNFNSKFYLNLFSGNNYFCFIEPLSFYYYYLTIINDNNNIDLLGICFNNYFFNINFNLFNLSNKLLYNYFLIFYIYNICLYIFFFKIIKFLRILLFKFLIFKKNF